MRNREIEKMVEQAQLTNWFEATAYDVKWAWICKECANELMGVGLCKFAKWNIKMWDGKWWENKF